MASKIKSLKLFYVIAALLLIVACLLTIRYWPRPSLAAQIPTSQAFMADEGELLRLTLAGDQQYRVWTPLQDISPALINAVLLYEDRWFYWHVGVNPQAILRAAFRTYRQQGQQGGSTISMQLVRLFYGLNTKTLSGKLQQMAMAIWLEMRFSKTEILEAYLNLAPYGSNVQGVGAASLIYFDKTASHLSLSEALSLAVIPQQPNKRAGNHALDNAIQAPKARLIERWKTHYSLTDDQLHLVKLPVHFRKIQELPFHAPHFTQMLIQQRELIAGLDKTQVQTSLNLSLQAVIERQTRQYLQEVRSKGIENVTALLIDPKTMDVKAWMGSADYANRKIHGQVNGVLAKRSPGSTLKPFIYALAMDQGILHPASILKDAPMDFGPYTPENFDGRFRGPITAQDALINSRNIPAVWVASQLQAPSFYNFLSMAGIAQLRSEDHYGLALVLGGGEVTMEELAILYAMLANKGAIQPLRYVKDQKLRNSTPLISPEASFITLDMLRHNPPPDQDESFQHNSGWSIGWKTGTSWGFRDAWSVGLVGPYVLAVWIGNFDGTGNPAFVGIDAAAPLFFRIANALYLHKPVTPTPAITPKGISQLMVCSASGDLPNKWCPEKRKTLYIPGKSPIKVSQLHQPVAISIKTGQPVCPPYQADKVRMEVMEFWSSDMQKLFRQAGLPRRSPPKCRQTFQTDPPDISSPLRHVTYQLRSSKPDVNIPLQAKTAAHVRTLFWFDDNRYVGSSDPLTALAYRPKDAGIHMIRVVDDQGQVAEREIRVNWSK